MAGRIFFAIRLNRRVSGIKRWGVALTRVGFWNPVRSIYGLAPPLDALESAARAERDVEDVPEHASLRTVVHAHCSSIIRLWGAN